MPDYIPPKNTEIPFIFGKKGYAAPDFDKVPFEFESGSAIKDLKNAITGMALKTDYLKSCDTHVIGYSSGVVQTLRSNCIYGGFRDLQLLIKVSNYLDLPSYISGAIRSVSDFGFLFKSWSRELPVDVRGTINGWLRGTSKDLHGYIREGFKGQSDLNERLNIWQHQQEDFSQAIKGWSTGVIVDLVNAVKPTIQSSSDFSEYIKSTIQESEDLNLDIYKIWQHQHENVNFMLHGWVTSNLKLILQPFHIEDLPVLIRSTYVNNIGAYLYAIQPVDITASLMGWAVKDLSVYIAKGAYAGDLPANIYGINSINLSLLIDAKKGIEIIRDLNIRMTNLKVSDLELYLNVISYADLNAYLLSSRIIVDLQCMIYPKIVFVRHNVNVSFLEHRDLAAAINFSCVSSDFRELTIYLMAKHKFDLPCYIYGGDDSNIANLKCYINAADYISQDIIPVNFLKLDHPVNTTIVKYNNKVKYVIDTITVLGSGVKTSFADVSSSIIGDYMQRDLGFSIKAYSNRHYESPTVMKRFITLKLKNNIEDFRKYVELTFNSYANSYYYFSGSKKAYRAFRNDHWVVHVEGFKFLPLGAGFEKTKVRNKYVFNLKNYESIDDAITDMIDRVTLLRSSDLGVTIAGAGMTSEDLSFSIMPNDENNNINPRRIYKTNRTLNASIIVGNSSNKDLPTFIIPTYSKGTNDLDFSITGLDYENPIDGDVDFNFEGTGDTIPDAVDFIFIFGE